MNDLFGTFHELFRFGDAALDMFEAYGIDKTVADTLIHDKFHIQISFSMLYAVPVQFVDSFLASNSAENGNGAELIDMMVNGLHADGAHICEEKAGVKGA